MTLEQKINDILSNEAQYSETELNSIFSELLDKLNSGEIRSAEPDGSGGWKVNKWIKQGILMLFRHGKTQPIVFNEGFTFFDKHTLNIHPFTIDDEVRIVPGGSSIRNGCYVAKGVICMPPMYINIGSYVDSGTMIDSHALVGTCAQVGKRVHVSAAAQIGGVLEPAGSRPVIIEDDVLVGGNCGIYEGTLVRKRAVLASGVVLTGSTRVYDLVNNTIIRSSNQNPLEIPEGAVLVNGSRAIDTPWAREQGLSLSSPMIIKYRDEKTDAKTALEDALRS